MREEIKNLITTAEAKVTEFEKEIFINDRGFYMNAKTLIDDMIEQMVLIKKTVELEDYTQEIYNANKEDLEFIINTINQLNELTKTKTIHIIIEGKGNYRVQVLGEKEIAIDMSEKNLEIKDDTQSPQEQVEVVPTLSDTDSLDVSAIDSFLNNN